MRVARGPCVLFSAVALIACGLPAAADDPPVVGSKTRRGIKVAGRIESKTTRHDQMLGDRRSRGSVRRKVVGRPGVGKVMGCVVGVFDGTSCVEPRSRVELYPPLTRQPRPRVVRPDPRLITITQVRAAVREVAFPRLAVRIQPPGGKTLVNLKTIVYTTPVPFHTVVPILSWPVTVRATPHAYTWDFGDGHTHTTSTPGAPYPSFEIYHQYRHRSHHPVQVRVTVGYHARYRLPGTPGGAWRSLGIVAITGPPTPLLVCESTPRLVDPHHPDPPEPTTDPTNPCTR